MLQFGEVIVISVLIQSLAWSKIECARTLNSKYFYTGICNRPGDSRTCGLFFPRGILASLVSGEYINNLSVPGDNINNLC